jgi:hypothetical protein
MSDSQTRKLKLVTRVITVKEPKDGSGFNERKVRVQYEIIGRKEADQLAKEDDATFLARVVKGWGAADGTNTFKDDDGAAIAFSEETLASVSDVPWNNAALIRGYFDAANGGKLGN